MLIYAKRPSLCMGWPSSFTITVSGLSQLGQSTALSGPRQLCPACVPDSSWHSKHSPFSMHLKWLSHSAKRAIFWSQTFSSSIKTSQAKKQKSQAGLLGTHLWISNNQLWSNLWMSKFLSHFQHPLYHYSGGNKQSILWIGIGRRRQKLTGCTTDVGYGCQTTP